MKCYFCTLGSALIFLCVIVGSRFLYLHSCSDSEVFQGKYCAKYAYKDCDYTLAESDPRHWTFRSCADLGHKIGSGMCRDTSQTGNSCFYAASPESFTYKLDECLHQCRKIFWCNYISHDPSGTCWLYDACPAGKTASSNETTSREACVSVPNWISSAGSRAFRIELWFDTWEILLKALVTWTRGILMVISFFACLNGVARSNWRQLLGTLVRYIRANPLLSQEEDPQETRVKHELLVRRVDRAQSVVMVAAGIAPLVFAVNMMHGDKW